VPESSSAYVDSQLDDITTAEHHFATNIKLAWQKLDSYSNKLNNTPIYVAAVVLHPRFKWKYFEVHWHEHPNWIRKARTAFSRLLGEYQYQVTEYSPPPQPHLPKRQRPTDDIDSYSSDDDSEFTADQQFSQYLCERNNKTLVRDIESSPIDYWLTKRRDWPQLSALALDIYSIAVMSDEPERVFSTTGAAVSQRRRRLQSDTIGHLMCLKAWVKAEIVTIDGCLYSLPYSQVNSKANHRNRALFSRLPTSEGLPIRP